MNSEAFKNLINVKRPRYAKSIIPLLKLLQIKGSPNQSTVSLDQYTSYIFMLLF